MKDLCAHVSILRAEVTPSLTLALTLTLTRTPTLNLNLPLLVALRDTPS